ncbi:LysR family transcriptional regulator [Candidatus Synechococcus calcipolaris G9]|uniref:LysR family transcriptional regulator n=1 Tax=Candidatus Synechococcus calcipolaris G9 TaxID=1497997 RepID=A0ABT6EWI0_9SYNE|nr:LysR family transcriptional regulator [Candidatus Synechococcus calcipolaris]MDG2989601.1 LysR family transcriptional regulator [Candidatus Synechococcus calcipolaris G9]
MRIEQLQAFLAVADTGSFQQAALQCGVSQPTISRQIQALEADLGAALFHRSNQTSLTLAGDIFLRRAKKMWQEWQTVHQELLELHQGKQTELCIGAIHSICTNFLPALLPKFCHQFPLVQLRVTALGSDRALKVLRDGLVDLVIVMNNHFTNQIAGLVSHTLYDEPIRLLMAAHHPLAQLPIIPWSDLRNYPQVIFKDGYGMRRLVEEEFLRRHTPLQAALELNTPEAFRGVIRESQMLAFLPESALSEAAKDPLLTIRDVMDNDQSSGLRRQVAVITTGDRLAIPPIDYLFKLIVAQSGMNLL